MGDIGLDRTFRVSPLIRPLRSTKCSAFIEWQRDFISQGLYSVNYNSKVLYSCFIINMPRH
jgi:hypothetical protein